jgi:hypothetical protein
MSFSNGKTVSSETCDGPRINRITGDEIRYIGYPFLLTFQPGALEPDRNTTPGNIHVKGRDYEDLSNFSRASSDNSWTSVGDADGLTIFEYAGVIQMASDRAKIEAENERQRLDELALVYVAVEMAEKHKRDEEEVHIDYKNDWVVQLQKNLDEEFDDGKTRDDIPNEEEEVHTVDKTKCMAQSAKQMGANKTRNQEQCAVALLDMPLVQVGKRKHVEVSRINMVEGGSACTPFDVQTAVESLYRTKQCCGSLPWHQPFGQRRPKSPASP